MNFMQLNQQLAIKYIRAKFKLLSSLSKIKTAEKAFDLFCTPQRRTRKEFPPVFKLAEKMHFPFGGSIVHGFRWNHPASRKVLILHGFESGVVNFDQYVSALVNKGYEVLAFDAPAHGRSTGERINVLT